MEGKISKYLLRSICLFVGVFIVSESLWACSYEEKEDRTNIKADTVLTYLDYPMGKLYIYNSEGSPAPIQGAEELRDIKIPVRSSLNKSIEAVNFLNKVISIPKFCFTAVSQVAS